jgi:hypothetical protein
MYKEEQQRRHRLVNIRAAILRILSEDDFFYLSARRYRIASGFYNNITSER